MTVFPASSFARSNAKIDRQTEGLASPLVARQEREILEHAVRVVAEQAVKADELVDEAKAAGGGDHPVTVHAKMLRLELLKVKADLERELETWAELHEVRS